MYSPLSNAKKEIDNQLKPDTVNEQTDVAIAVSYPLSFLHLESEEDSFVKGYN